jgi:O-Antigen ligase
MLAFFNVLLLLPFLLYFSDDTFILDLLYKRNIFRSYVLGTFSLFEVWVFVIFFYFLLYRLYVAKRNQSVLIIFGPLKPLIIFTLCGLVFGIAGAIRNQVVVSVAQIRYFCEGILLYVIILNTNLNTFNFKRLFDFVIVLVSAKSLYYLYMYSIGNGFYFQDVGYIIIGYGDILENTVLICLILFSRIITLNPKSTNLGKYILVLLSILLNTLIVFLSLRRSYMAMYIIGIIVILLLSKARSLVSCMILVTIFLLSIGISMNLFHKQVSLEDMFIRLESINVFKYGDDKGGDITSSTGHISDVISGWNNVKEDIILGKGFGVKIKRSFGWNEDDMFLHSEILFYWIRMGIFGLLVFLSMYIIPIGYCINKTRMKSFSEYQWFFAAVGGYLVGKFILGLTFYPPISVSLSKSYIYFILIGIIMNSSFLSRIQNLKE